MPARPATSRDPHRFPESTIWTLRKDGRTAETRICITPVGPDLRCYLDGALLWSKIVREPGGVGRIALERRLDFQAMGWRPA